MATPETSPVKMAVNDYLKKDLVVDFAQWPVHQKLSLFTQKTPRHFIRERLIDGKKMKYVPFQFSRKFLNFIFNFNISNEILREDYVEYDEEYMDYKDKKKKTRHVIEAEATVKFTFTGGNQTMIRTVKSSHKQYKNKALTRADAMKSAFSKSWTLAAQSFGICADLDKDPDQIIVDDHEEGKKSAPQKDFIDVEPEETTQDLGF